VKRVKIDWDDLEGAFEFSSYEARHYLDTDTGEIILLSDAVDDLERLEEEIEGDTAGRYVDIPLQDSHEGYRDMEDFIETVADSHQRELLEVAIDGRGAFRRFKDVLERFPADRERWFAFERERLRERIREWLEENEIQPIE